MGYANSIPYQEIQVVSTLGGPVTVTTVATTRNVATIYIPDFTFPLSHAYIDMVIQGVADTSGAINYLVGDSTTMLDGLGTARKIGDITTTGIRQNASVYSSATYVIPGNYDVAQYITSGMDIQTQIFESEAHGNNLVLYDVFARARLYFGM